MSAPGATDPAPVTLCIPVFDDWGSVLLLIDRIDAVVPHLGSPVSIVLVDDGSTEPAPLRMASPPRNVGRVEILHLRRNVGHQRAIALGLAFIYAERLPRAALTVVMDGDGEDSPGDVAQLIERCRANGYRTIVFAERARRSERLGFRLGYVAFKVVHYFLTGRSVKVGNFSVLPAALLARVVSVSELWNHYAAGVFNARLPIDMVPIPRERRLVGHSKMDVSALVVHGMSAISVYGATVGVRLLWVTCAMIAIVMAAAVSLLGIRALTGVGFPAWSTSATAVLAILLLNLLMLSLMFVLFVLQARNIQGFLPVRDWAHYVLGRTTIHEADGADL